MRKSTYSFGPDSPLKFKISDKMAKNYNEAVEQFFKAQQRFNQKFGRRWDPRKDPFEMHWTRKQKQAWNDFAKVMKKAIKETGPYHQNDIMDDFLVKSSGKSAPRTAIDAAGSLIGGHVEIASVTASAASKRWDVTLSLAAAVGALYGLLRGF